MEAGELLRVAREIVAKVPMCVAITVDRMGKAHARTVETSELSDEWTLRFMTDRRTRKVEDIEQTGQLVLSFQHAPDNAYVTLTGRATLIRDSAVKQAIWRPQSLKWHPGGPTDPNVVLVEFFTERVEMWSSRHGVTPDPKKGLWAAALTRSGSGWDYDVTSRRSPPAC